MSAIAAKKMVTATYDLYVDGENEEELMEQATEQQPLVFCFGIGMMLERFEQNLKGKKAGDKFDFVIDHSEAYGEYDDESVVDLPKNIFEVDGKFDNEMIAEGSFVPLMDSEGNRVSATVVKVGDTTVTVDLNHPLAGENLHFIGEILEVRDATEEELIAILNPSCGGGCSSDCSDGCGCGCGE
ncbi:MAG: FKBP-type peptidyl-prolyl cis-trans isomerase [Prevotellaceae bacterium]|jgi:FKBP-type peptidyl-prolyl cis-trans isomerase SlyD|nr:FKBP-type peptidyl-prolyl cis-trans isomerase [Prevotellaceae bacterium]